MSVILGALMGVFIGITFFALVSVNKINTLESKSRYYKQKYLDEKFKRQQRDILIKDYQEESEILLMNAKEYRAKIKNLENNLEICAFNVPELKKELVTDSESDN